MDLSTRSGPKFVCGECIVGFCKFGQSRDQDPHVTGERGGDQCNQRWS